MDSSLEFLNQQALLGAEWVQFKEDLLQITKHIILINQNLVPATDSKNLIRRLQFLCYELRSQINDWDSPESKLETLNDFFFFQKNFYSIEDDADHEVSYKSSFLDWVLTKRSGSPVTITLIYNHLAKHIGLPLYFVDLDPKCFLKFSGSVNTQFIDLSRGGKSLSATELIENMRTRLQNDKISSSKICENISPLQFLVNYLYGLRRYLAAQSQLKELLIVQNSLLDLLPQNLQLLGERAVLYYKLNLPKSSVSDLKRYFSFQTRDRAPQELVRIYDEIIGHV